MRGDDSPHRPSSPIFLIKSKVGGSYCFPVCKVSRRVCGVDIFAGVIYETPCYRLR